MLRILNSKNFSLISTAVGAPSPGGTDGSRKVLRLRRFFPFEVGLAFSSGLEGILGTIQCASGCRHFDQSHRKSHPEGEVSLSESIGKVYNDMLMSRNL